MKSMLLLVPSADLLHHAEVDEPVLVNPPVRPAGADERDNGRREHDELRGTLH